MIRVVVAVLLVCSSVLAINPAEYTDMPVGAGMTFSEDGTNIYAQGAFLSWYDRIRLSAGVMWDFEDVMLLVSINSRFRWLEVGVFQAYDIDEDPVTGGLVGVAWRW